MEEELVWETHGCESRCRGRVDMVGARGHVHRGRPRERLALHMATSVSVGHLGLLCDSGRDDAQAQGTVAAHLGLCVSWAGQARGDGDPC